MEKLTKLERFVMIIITIIMTAAALNDLLNLAGNALMDQSQQEITVINNLSLESKVFLHQTE